MTVFLILTAIAYGIFKTGCFILLGKVRISRSFLPKLTR
ncbi:Uncharacterised protein [Klebsiella variicola]|nr:Uncharacterised protein [Klebsiella variicola]